MKGGRRACSGGKRKCLNPLNAICPTCKTEKPLADFNINKCRSNGHVSECRICNVQSRKIKIPKAKRLCLKCGKSTHKERYCSRLCYNERRFILLENGSYLKQCPKCNEFKPMNGDHFAKSSKLNHGYHCYCKVCDSEKTKAFNKSLDPAVRKQRRRASNIKNAEHNKEYRKSRAPVKLIQEAHRRKTDPSFVLKNRMRSRMFMALKKGKGGERWQDLLGYTVDDLKKHLQKKFLPGMTWELFLNGAIHIDHRVPVAAHNIKGYDSHDFKRCWALKNLQPMWADDNMAKSDHLTKHFQPSLAI